MTTPTSSQQPQTDLTRRLLRHTLATLAYRGGKALKAVPEGFADFRAGHLADAIRTPGQILAHIGDLLDWALSLALGKQEWRSSAPLPWSEEVNRFFSSLAALDVWLAQDIPLAGPVEKIFQGPIADAFTHVGQISILRRLAGSPIRSENYLRAQIAVGVVGPEQPDPKFEFD